MVLQFLGSSPRSQHIADTTDRSAMVKSTEVISSCLNLMRRLPPKDIENSLAGLLNLRPEATDELLQRVDQVYQSLRV